jgi:hypothetical protein
MKKLLFPFLNKNEALKKYWWHRFSMVLYFFVLVAIFGSFFVKLNGIEESGRNNCLSLQESMISGYYSNKFENVTKQRMLLESNKSSYTTTAYTAKEDALQNEWDNIYAEMGQKNADCIKNYPIHAGLNFLLGLIGTLLLSYLLQIIYYKVVLYIVIGNQQK